ncbi:AraC-like DNA-binding protein [Arthrobacter pigmenti]|uniref:AraC-like DNA-binding protein n=1 Tax=Arthrobacter pigmenti TaxID=271432 RepID=A0A846RT62_9MICC|nr:helix-turn-helix transcriptional regulator [Arthrobacter pigmenti]NJC23684.1 AraC-like DNA-binding protein [Arthrobacter pigmenti]
MSQSMLRRKILSSTGLTPKELVMQQRLSRAQNLLVETDLPIHHIAERVGYEDAGHFSRLFVRRLGMSPLAFRREQRGTLEGSDR